MANEWDQRSKQGNPFYKQKGPRYAQNSMNVSWTQLLDYEQREAGSALTEQGGSDSVAEEGVSECPNDDAARAGSEWAEGAPPCRPMCDARSWGRG